MGKGSIPEKALLFSSVLFHEKPPADKAVSRLKNYFGETCFETPPMSFTYTDYYHQEMGSPLYRVIIAFSDLVPRDSMTVIKTNTNEIEADFLIEGKRSINLDPGLLTLENVCLATTKPYSHRLYLGQGIWAEITLIYKGNSYQKLEWTYPDYASFELIEVFNTLRDMYKRRLRCQEA